MQRMQYCRRCVTDSSYSKGSYSNEKTKKQKAVAPPAAPPVTNSTPVQANTVCFILK